MGSISIENKLDSYEGISLKIRFSEEEEISWK